MFVASLRGMRVHAITIALHRSQTPAGSRRRADRQHGELPNPRGLTDEQGVEVAGRVDHRSSTAECTLLPGRNRCSTTRLADATSAR